MNRTKWHKKTSKSGHSDAHACTTVVQVCLPHFMPTALWGPHQIHSSWRKNLGLWMSCVNVGVQAKNGQWLIYSLTWGMGDLKDSAK